MDRRRRTLVWIIASGGSAVLASYLYGLLARPAAVARLWEVVPEAIRPAWWVSIALGTAGFMAPSVYLSFGVDASQATVAGRWGYGLFDWLYLLILIPSALYVPLGVVMVQNPGPTIWAGLRLSLAVVGLAGTGLFLALVGLRPREPRTFYWSAVAGSAVFAVHTIVVDALVWPALFAG